MTLIKICGLTRQDDIDVVNNLLPEFIGFVFFGKSRRYVSVQQVELLKKRVNPLIRTVGVFVNESLDLVANIMNNNIIDIAQLHGNESNEYICELRRLTSKKIIKAFSVKSSQELADALNSLADYVLLDSGEGGTGKQFNWDLLSEFNKPYFLAGGLDPNNIGNAVKLLKPFAVDVSSGVETNGVKDSKKIAAFISAVRKA